MEHLVSADWLASELGAPDLVVLDCTVHLRMGADGFASVSGRDDWAAGHIPGAGFADLQGELADTASPFGYAVPAPEVFAAAMANLGVGDDSRVVLYDDGQAMWAARVWWMLRWIGFDNAALLDGGMAAWQAAGGATTSEHAPPEPGQLAVTLRPELIADKAEVMAIVGSGGTCLIDALPEPVYSGEMAMYGDGGHIPGAINTPAMGLVDAETRRFLPADQLASRFPHEVDERIVTYCGGGIAASANAFVLTMLGHSDVAVYTASLQEWVTDPDAPLVKS